MISTPSLATPAPGVKLVAARQKENRRVDLTKSAALASMAEMCFGWVRLAASARVELC
jgi:hypothetical protein